MEQCHGILFCRRTLQALRLFPDFVCQFKCLSHLITVLAQRQPPPEQSDFSHDFSVGDLEPEYILDGQTYRVRIGMKYFFNSFSGSGRLSRFLVNLSLKQFYPAEIVFLCSGFHFRKLPDGGIPSGTKMFRRVQILLPNVDISQHHKCLGVISARCLREMDAFFKPENSLWNVFALLIRPPEKKIKIRKSSVLISGFQRIGRNGSHQFQ